MIQQIRRMTEQSASLLLLLLFSSDIAFTVLDILNTTLGPNSELCNIAGLCAYMKSYHLVKIFWVVILFAYILKLTRSSSYVSWVLLFLFFLIDDAFNIHQNIGGRLANGFGGYVSHDLGLGARYFELGILAVTGMTLLAIVAWAYFHGPYTFKKISNDMFLFIAALVFFGGLVDLANAIKLGPTVEAVLGIIEDSGERVVYSLILWDVFLLVLHNGKADLFLHDLLLNRGPHQKLARDSD